VWRPDFSPRLKEVVLMVRKHLWSSVFASICLLVVSLPLSAQGNSCTARGVFSSCTVHCPLGQTPVCSTGFLGLSTSCTCSGGSSLPDLAYDRSQGIAFEGYTQELADFSSSEAKIVLDLANKMMDAVKSNDWAAYVEAAAAHEEALKQLPEDELDKIYEFLGEPKP
jgi:hypothetical protein